MVTTRTTIALIDIRSEEVKALLGEQCRFILVMWRADHTAKLLNYDRDTTAVDIGVFFSGLPLVLQPTESAADISLILTSEQLLAIAF